MKQLYKYQRAGVRWLIARNGTGLIGDDMGLGKTCQALTYLYTHPELRPALIVCSSTMKLKWRDEIIEWTRDSSIHLIEKKTATLVPPASFYIINYDILATEHKIKLTKKKKGGGWEYQKDRHGKVKYKKVLKDTSWIFKLVQLGIKAIIVDECQALANPTAIRTKGIVTLKKAIPGVRFIPLSGTPIKSKPAQFFTILNLLDERHFPNRWKYLHRYCDPKHNGFGWTFDGATEVAELQQKLETLMLRRTKDEVLPDLPKKQKIIIPMQLEPVALATFNQATEEFIAWLREKTEKPPAELKNTIGRLKQLAYMAKRNSVIQWIEEYIATGNKLVVGAWHTSALDDLVAHFKTTIVKIDGSVKAEDRYAAVERFQTDPTCSLIALQLMTAPGLTLTAASATCTIEFGWDPADHEQFEDRVHRIGQKADSVTAYYLIAPGTVDEDNMAIIQTKYGVVKQILDKQDGADIFIGNAITELLTRFKRRLEGEPT